MDYIKTHILQAAMDSYSQTGWDNTLSHAVVTHDDVLLKTLLRVDLHYRIVRATKHLVDLTPQLTMNWIMYEDGRIVPVKDT